MLVIGRGELVAPAAQADEDLGGKGARLLVKAFLPVGPDCHAETYRILREMAQEESTRLRVQVFAMGSEAAQAEMRREGITCATVLVNNRISFDLPAGDSVRKVTLSRRSNAPDSTYHSEDVRVIIKRELERLYPSVEQTPGDR